MGWNKLDEVNDMNYGRSGGYGGTVSSGYFSGGGSSTWSRGEEWDGSTWSKALFGERNGDVGGCSPTHGVYNIGSMYDGGQGTNHTILVYVQCYLVYQLKHV